MGTCITSLLQICSILFSYFLGTVVEDLTNNASSDIMDIEDEESSPVASVPNENGNLPVNPIPDKPSFIHQTNGVRKLPLNNFTAKFFDLLVVVYVGHIGSV